MARSDKGNADRELNAIQTILQSLDGLDGESIQRVFDYVFGRLSLTIPKRTSYAASVGFASSGSYGITHSAEAGSSEPGKIVSIRDLKEEKQPTSSNQMAALVAYYLSELAPQSERRSDVTSADLQKYFKQAGFKLPKHMPSTLPNATAAGYFDGLGGGRYKLNPVGYNLVVHGMPRDEKANHSPTKRTRRAPARKAKAKSKSKSKKTSRR